jgi:hypothetical protein
MTPNKTATAFRWAAAIGFFLTAAGHASAYGKMSNEPAIWFVFSFQQLALGLIVILVARNPMPRDRLVLFCAASAPLLESLLMVKYLGFILPTFLVLGSGLLPLIAGLLFSKSPGPAT